MYNDSPIKDPEKDCLNRMDFVYQLYQMITNYNYSDSLTIGLESKWGDGKTSIINLLLNLLNENIIVIKFNPWNLSDDLDLYDKFFNELLFALESNNHENKLNQLKISLKKYQHQVSPVMTIGGLLVQILTRIPVNFGEKINDWTYGKKSIEELKEDINSEIFRQKVKILIIIDDIDRLSDKNIRLIFNLAASVANFNNIIYLLAYDREVVIKSLNQSQCFSGEKYLEKIIQVPISLPKNTKTQLKDYFKKGIDDVFNNLIYPLMRNIIYILFLMI